MKRLILIILIFNSFSSWSQSLEYFNYSLKKELEYNKDFLCRPFFCSTLKYDTLLNKWKSDMFEDIKPIDLFTEPNSQDDFFLKPSVDGFDTFWVQRRSFDSIVFRKSNHYIIFKLRKYKEDHYLERAWLTAKYSDDSITLEVKEDGKVYCDFNFIGYFKIQKSNFNYIVFNCRNILSFYNVKISGNIGKSQLSFQKDGENAILIYTNGDGRRRYLKLLN